MKDFFSNELHVGDSVAYVEFFNKSKVFKNAVVVGFKTKMVVIKYGDEAWMESLRHPEQLIKDLKDEKKEKYQE